jgi:hypothetical protein
VAGFSAVAAAAAEPDWCTDTYSFLWLCANDIIWLLLQLLLRNWLRAVVLWQLLLLQLTGAPMCKSSTYSKYPCLLLFRW